MVKDIVRNVIFLGRKSEAATKADLPVVKNLQEVIEAHWLFDMPYEKIDVVVHPQSVIHSLVEYQDGSVLAQLGLPDMRLPIQYAFSYPERFDNAFGQLDLVKAGQLTFEAPDLEAFPAPSLS